MLRNIPTLQLFDNFMAPMPSVCFAVHLARSPAFAASLTFSQHHAAVISHCILARFGCLHSRKTPHMPKKTSKPPKRPNPRAPKPHHQYFILKTTLIPWSCFPIWKAAVILPDFLFCPVTALLQEEN